MDTQKPEEITIKSGILKGMACFQCVEEWKPRLVQTWFQKRNSDTLLIATTGSILALYRLPGMRIRESFGVDLSHVQRLPSAPLVTLTLESAERVSLKARGVCLSVGRQESFVDTWSKCLPTSEFSPGDYDMGFPVLRKFEEACEHMIGPGARGIRIRTHIGNQGYSVFFADANFYAYFLPIHDTEKTHPIHSGHMPDWLRNQEQPPASDPAA